MVTVRTNPSPSLLRSLWAGDDEFIADGVVTLLLRNIPRQYTVDELLVEVNSFFPVIAYNFVLLPWDHKKNMNVGSCFMNCNDFPAACAYFCALSGHQFDTHPSRKRCQVMAARVQGLELNLAYCVLTSASSSTQSNRHMPIILDENGKRVDARTALVKSCSKEIWADAARLASRKFGDDEVESRDHENEIGEQVDHEDRTIADAGQSLPMQAQLAMYDAQTDDAGLLAAELASIPFPSFGKTISRRCKEVQPKVSLELGIGGRPTGPTSASLLGPATVKPCLKTSSDQKKVTWCGAFECHD